MLQLLKESVTSKYAERLEQIVIALIAIEIGVLFSLFWISNINRAANSSGDHNNSRRPDGGWINTPSFVFILCLEHALILRRRLIGQLTVSHGFTAAPLRSSKLPFFPSSQYQDWIYPQRIMDGMSRDSFDCILGSFPLGFRCKLHGHRIDS